MDTPKKSEDYNKAVTLQNSALKLINNGNNKAGLLKLEAAVTLAPHAPEFYHCLAQFLYNIKRHNDAIEHLLKGIKVAEPSLNLFAYHSLLGACYLEMSNNSAAITHFETSIQLNPTYSYNFYNLGVIYEQMDQTDLAIVQYETAASFSSDNFFLYARIGSIYERQKKYNDAVKYYKKFVEKGNPSSLHFYELARIYQIFLQQDDDAIVYYQKAVNLDSNNFKALFHMGEIFFNRDAYDLADEKFQLALKNENKMKTSEIGAAYLCLGTIAHHKDDADKTIEYFNIAGKNLEKINFDRKIISALYNTIAVTYMARSNQKKTHMYLSYALYNDPNNEVTLYNIGVYYQQFLDSDTLATTYYQKAIATAPSHAPSHCNMGSLHLKNKWYAQAIHSFELALQSDTPEPVANFGLGDTYYYLGNYERTITYYKRGLEYVPHNADALLNLARFYLKHAVDYKQTFKYLKKYLKICPKDLNALQTFGFTAYILDKKKACAEALEEYLENNSEPENLYLIYTMIEICNDRYVKAQKYAIKHISLFPNESLAYLCLAEALQNLGSNKEAQKQYDLARGIDPRLNKFCALKEGLQNSLEEIEILVRSTIANIEKNSGFVRIEDHKKIASIFKKENYSE